MFVTARLLGPDGRGMLAVLVAWSILFATLAGLSLGEVVQHRIQQQDRRDWLPGALGTLLPMAAILSAVAGLVAVILYRLTDGRLIDGVPGTFVAVAFLALPLLIWNIYARNLLFAAGAVRDYNTIQVIGATLGLAAVLVLLLGFDLGVIGVVIGQTIGYAFMSVATGMALFRRAGDRMVASLQEARRMIAGAAKLHANTIGVVLLAQTDIVMLNHFAGVRDVGWYQLGFQLMAVMLVVPQAGTMVLYSRMAEIGPDRLWVEQKALILQTLGLVALLSVVAFLLAPVVVVWLAGPEFEPSVGVFVWLLPVLLGRSLALLMAPQWIGRGLFALTSGLTMATAVANAGLNYLWIPQYGMMGAVWATLVSFLGVVAVAQIIFAVWCDRRCQAVQTG